MGMTPFLGDHLVPSVCLFLGKKSIYTYIDRHVCLYMYIHMYLCLDIYNHINIYYRDIIPTHPPTHTPTHKCTHACTHTYILSTQRNALSYHFPLLHPAFLAILSFHLHIEYSRPLGSVPSLAPSLD